MTTDAAWLCPDGAPRVHPWLVPADWDELICDRCIEDEGCCECDSPVLMTPLEHKARVWRDRVVFAEANDLDPVDLSPRPSPVSRATGTDG